MVTRQIDECDHFRGTLTNLLCRTRLAVIHDLRMKQACVKAHQHHPELATFKLNGSFLTSPLLLKPRISKLMLEVRPVWISWRCLKRLSLALPRPLSSSPCVKTPNKVDFPESTFPSTATRRSKNYRKHTKQKDALEVWKIKKQKRHFLSSPTNLLVIWHLANENFSNLARHIGIIIHLSLS